MKISTSRLLILTIAFCIPSFSLHTANAQTDTWIGDVNGNWFTDSNWVDGSKPTLASDVLINAVGSDYRVDLHGNTSIDSLAMSSTNATLWTYSVGGLLTANVTGSVDLFAGTLRTGGSYTINAGSGVTNHGGILWATNHTATTINNGFLNKSGGTINVSGARNNLGTAKFGAFVQINGGLINQGHIDLNTYTGGNGAVFSTLSVAGTLDNSGLIDAKMFTGTNTGARTIQADNFINSANVINNDVAALNLNKSGATYTNSGVINAAVGKVDFQNMQSLNNTSTGQMLGTSMNFQGIGGSNSTATNAGVINLSGNLDLSSLDLENSGSVHVGGTLKTSFNTYKHKTGALISGTTLNATNGTLDLENGMFVNFDNLNLTNGTVQGNGVLETKLGTATTLLGINSQAGVDWENNGSALLHGANTIFADIHGKFTNKTDGELRVRGTRSNSGHTNAGATMRMHGGLDNEGTVKMETYHGGGPYPFAKLDVTGTFDNSGILDSRPYEGANIGIRSVSADVFNNTGTVVQNDTYQLDFNKSGATYTSSGAIDINSGLVRFLNVGSFSNSGEINLADGTTFRVTGTSFTNEVGGSINGTGDFVSSVATFLDNGLLMPGQSPGVLDMNVVNYVQSSVGVLEMEIGGLTGGTEYDQINIIGGSATFNGTLRLKFIDGFAASMGDEFDLIFGSATASFGAVEIFGLQDGYMFDTETAGGSFTLTALNNTSSVPEPGAAGMFALLLLGASFRRRRS